MKFLVVFAVLFGMALGQFPSYKPTYRQSGLEKYAHTLKNNFDIGPDGSYQYAYETDNGISAQENGYEKNLGGFPPVQAKTAQGTFSWTSPEGKFISFGYTADENGYRVVGDALPTPPPIPAYILRSIEFNKAKSAQRPFGRF